MVVWVNIDRNVIFEDCSFNNSVDVLLNEWLMSIIKRLEAERGLV